MLDLKFSEILDLNRRMEGEISSKPYEIGILSNVTVNALKDILLYGCRKNQIEPKIEIGNFDNIVQDSSVFSRKDLVIVLYDTLNIVDQVSEFLEDLDEEMYSNFLSKLRAEIDIICDNLSSCPSVIFNKFSALYFPASISTTRVERVVHELNQHLEAKKPRNFTLVEVDRIYAQVGMKDAIDYRFYRSSKAPYTVTFLKHYVMAIEPVLLRNTGKLRKAIIFDCDNTLWKGVIGEDGIDGIDMSLQSKVGKYFNQVQKIAVYLSKRGVIVGLCSKNNEADVLEVLERHPEMVLRENHIVVNKINWDDKAQNLRKIAGELNIGTDSLVFVDDSNFEINLIREQIPEILAIQVPSDITSYPNLILQTALRHFNLDSNEDDLKKTEMYKQQKIREGSKASFHTLEDYLRSLEIRIEVQENPTQSIERIAQLTQKTNQFNLTTIRYTESQIDALMRDENYRVFTLSVRDKFGDSGLTGVCILCRETDKPASWRIETLLMSCRVIGRNIEIAFLESVLGNIVSNGAQVVYAEYRPTQKNTQVEDFYGKLGFVLSELSHGRRHYVLNVSTYMMKQIDYIRVESHFRNINTKIYE